MGLYKYYPEPSGRMGILWTLGLIADAAILEFGAMGHMLYAEKWLQQTGVRNRSKLYTPHIDEKDIALGITQRLEDAIDEIVKNDSHKAIFLLPSSIPEVIGVDLELIGEEMQAKYSGIPIITFKRGGFQETYHQGIEEALYKVVKCIPENEGRTKDSTFNIIGSCADLNKFQSDERELIRILKGTFGIESLCSLSSDASVDKIQHMGASHINVVIRKEGLKAAKELERRFKTPFVYARPYGYEGTIDWLRNIGQLLHRPMNQAFLDNELLESSYALNYCKQALSFKAQKGRISLGGNIDVVTGIMKFACDELGMQKGFIWCDNKEYKTEDIPYWDEAKWMSSINKDIEGILMASKAVLAKAGRDKTMAIDRSLDSWNFNWYSPPYMGFRGAMNLCSLWLESILE